MNFLRVTALLGYCFCSFAADIPASCGASYSEESLDLMRAYATVVCPKPLKNFVLQPELVIAVFFDDNTATAFRVELHSTELATGARIVKTRIVRYSGFYSTTTIELDPAHHHVEVHVYPIPDDAAQLVASSIVLSLRDGSNNATTNDDRALNVSRF